MSIETFQRDTWLNAAADDVYAWHSRPGALQRLIPPWENVRVVAHAGGIEAGARVSLKLRILGLPIAWEAEHTECVPGRKFTDAARHGPFPHWVHEHTFEPAASGGSILRDRLSYRLPGGIMGRVLGGAFVRRQLDRAFRYRHTVTRQDLAMHHEHVDAPRLTIAISGANGLIGSALAALLSTGGHRVLRLVRRPPRGDGEVGWDPRAGLLDPASLEGVDALVHLAGSSIAAGRWTSAVKDEIRSSRVDATRALVGSLKSLQRPPTRLLFASAIGIYGDRGDDVLTEASGPGRGFLVDVAREWETAARSAESLGGRVAILRIGVVASLAGGFLQKLLPIFQLGLGGPVGSGKQWVSWISIDDVIAAIHHVLMNERVSGPVNLVAPNPVTNAECGRIIGHVIGRPAMVWAPAAAIRMMYGEMADETVLASTRVEPAVLRASGFRWRHETLDAALRHVLGRRANEAGE